MAWSDLWAALALVLVIEGLLLFALPKTWKRVVAEMLEEPAARLRVIGGTMLVAGLLLLVLVRS